MRAALLGDHEAPDESFPQVGDAHGGHEIGVGLRAVVVLFAAFAVYAAVLGVAAHGTEAAWGRWAAGGYGVAALATVLWWRRRPSIPLLIALAGTFVIPAAVLPSTWGATSEVRVVERAASLWLSHGTPYLASNQLSSWRSYNPYLPGMSLFGLPHAAGLPGVLGEPLLFLALATTAILAVACGIVAPGAKRGCPACHRTALGRALLLVACPALAFPMALGVTDPPVIALMCLGLAWTARPLLRQEGKAATQAGDAAALSSAGAVWKRRGRPLYAGVAIGIGCALKATAWPALPVIFALVALRDGRRAATRFAGAALGSFVVLTAVMAPALLTRAGALWRNIVAYPLGFSRGRTPAASPLPGHLLASAGAAGHVAAILLLGAAAIAMGVSLVIRPPRGLRQTAVRLAVGLTLMFLFAPDARFGYFAYPLGIVLFLFVAVASPRREILGEARADRTPAGPPLSFAPACAAPVRSYRDPRGQPS